MSELAVLTAVIAVASVAVNIGLLRAFLKLREKVSNMLYDAAGYKGCAENALDVATNISVNASEMYHAVFDEKAKVLDETLRRADETLKHAQALSDTLVDAFHHRLDEATRNTKKE